MHAARPPPRGPGVEEGFLLILAVALVTAPLCKLMRWMGERLRDACCDDDEDEVEHAELDGDGDGGDGGDGGGGHNAHSFFQTLTRHIFARG